MNALCTFANITHADQPRPLQPPAPAKKKKGISIAPFFYTIYFVEIRGRARRDRVKEMFVNIMCTAGGARRRLHAKQAPASVKANQEDCEKERKRVGGAQTPGTKTHSAAHFQAAFISAVSPPTAPSSRLWALHADSSESIYSLCLSPTPALFPCFFSPPPPPLSSRNKQRRR